MTMNLAWGSVAALGLVGLTASGAGFARTGDEGSQGSGLEEIVVTATRRVERLQDVAISVSDFSREQMEAQGFRNFDDLSRFAPGLTFMRTAVSSSGNYNDQSSDISIRGVQSSAGSSTTAIYIDDTPIQGRHIPFGAYNAFPQLFDLDRIEVLRGPQGTLFGASAEGGAVRFITPQPNFGRYSGYARSEVASTSNGALSYEIGSAIGGPIIDDAVAFRASLSFRRDGGWVDRASYSRPNPADPLSLPVYAGTTERNSNSQQAVTARATLRWKVSDDLSVTPSVYYQRNQIDDTAGYWIPLSDPSKDAFRNGNALKNPSVDPFTLVSLRFDWDLQFAKFVSNTSYFSRQQHSVSDLTQLSRALYASFALLPNIYPQPGDISPSPFADTQYNFFQEFRLASQDVAARWTWNTGLYFSHTNENVSQYEVDPTLNQEVFDYAGFNICNPSPCQGNVVYNAPVDRIVEKTVAIFGEIGLKLSDTLKATAGLRYAKIDYTGTVVNAAGTGSPDYITSVDSASEKPVTPKFSLAWQPDRNDLYYLSAAKGYREGGTNSGIFNLCGPDLAAIGLAIPAGSTQFVPPPYKADSLWSYELGAKNTLLDRRLQVNSSVFFIDWRNIQQSVYLPNCGASFVANLGQVHSKGGEIEVRARPVDSLVLGLTVAYLDAKSTRASCAGDLTFSGGACAGASTSTSVPPVVSANDHLVGSPWTLLASAEYSAHLPALGDRTAYIRLDFQHSSAQSDLLPTQDKQNALFDTTIPGLPTTQNLNLRLGLRFSNLDLSVFVNNVTNEHPLLSQSRDVTSNALDNLYYGRSVRPRSVGLTASYRH